MKLITLTQGQYAKVSDEDYDKAMQYTWYAALNKSQGIYRAVANTPNGKVKMHRFLMGETNVNVLIDHANGDTLDNQRHNLRRSNKSQNNANRKSKSGASSKFLGVFVMPTGEFHASIKKDGKKYHIGTFRNEILAAEAYNDAAKILHGEFARLNVIPVKKAS